MIDLWNPTHVSLGIDLLTGFLLGVLHGVTPDEHTWPITFSYAVGSYSTRGGWRAGVIFSAAFTLQRAIASELAYLGLSRLFTFGPLDELIYVLVGAVMVWAGLAIARGGGGPHLDWRRAVGCAGRDRPAAPDRFADPRPWMPAVHGFIAGWGFGAFATILYTVLAPAMPSAALGWAPGAAFGLGTMAMQAVAGGMFGYWAMRRGLPPAAVRLVGLKTAARTLLWGGVAFVLVGLFGLLFPRLAGVRLDTGLRIHNLHAIGLAFVLVIVVVMGIGFTSLVRETQALRKPPLAVPK